MNYLILKNYRGHLFTYKFPITTNVQISKFEPAILMTELTKMAYCFDEDQNADRLSI